MFRFICNILVIECFGCYKRLVFIEASNETKGRVSFIAALL